MNWTNFFVISLIAIVFIIGVIYIRRHGTCSSSDCASCGRHCSTAKQAKHQASFVEAYRKDHPKSLNENTKEQEKKQ